MRSRQTRPPAVTLACLTPYLPPMPSPDPTPPLSPPGPTMAPIPDSSGDARALPGGHRLDAYQLQGTVAATSTSVTYFATDLNLGVSTTLTEYFPVALAWRDAAGLVGPTETRYASAYHRGLAAFVDEARALAQCDHSSLVRVARLWQAGGTAYRVMQRHRKGRSLLDVRRSMTSPPDEASLLALMDGLLGALDAFHRAGHVHGGLHPANILLLEDDRPLLLSPDWAGRKLAAEFAGSAVIDARQPGFAPWEQLAAPLKPLPGAWVDLYALSEVVRFCISGEMPPPASKRRLGAAGEPTADMVRRLFGDALNWRYRNRLLRTLDVATSGSPQDRPDVAQFREWLVNGPPNPDRTSRAKDRAKATAAHTHAPGRADTTREGRVGASAGPHTDQPTAPPAPHEPEVQKPAAHEPAAHGTAAQEDSNAFLTPEFFERLKQAASGDDSETAAAAQPAPPAPDGVRAATPSPAVARQQQVDVATEPRDRLDPVMADWSAPNCAPPREAARLAPRPIQAAHHPRRTALLAVAAASIVVMAGLVAWWQLRQPYLQADRSISAQDNSGGDHVVKESPSTTTADTTAREPATDAALARADSALNGAGSGASAAAPTRPTRDTAPAAQGAPNRNAAAFPLPDEPTAAGPQPNSPHAANGRTKPANTDNPGRTAAARASGTGTSLRAPVSPLPSPDGASTRSPADESTPRGACGTRTLFALYRCMQTQCAQKHWQRHPQCERLKATDDVE